MAEELFFPFNAMENEEGEPDRLYDAEDFASYFAQFIGNGVYPNPSTNLQVFSLNGNMVLTVKAGPAFINGYGYLLKEDMYVAVNPSHVSYNRRDSVVLQLNLTTREIRCLYKAGTASASPVVPSLVRNDDIYELRLCEVLVPSGAVSIVQANITDTRLNNSVCGIVHGVVDQVSTTTLFTQYQNYLNSKITEWNNTKAQQATDWQGQMTAQQNGWQAKMTEIDAWYNGVKTDIAALQQFNFDNIAGLTGVARITTFTSSTVIDEAITKTVGATLVATRKTTFNANGSITVLLKVYAENGVDVMKQSSTITTFNANGTISEVVS